ncbi:MAG: hypothetical protein JXA94_05900 [Parachlamydiales bacterium]|nr:hypothetical protein [Parachlamydiales bacterium]
MLFIYVFGSFASNNQTQESDLNLAVFCDKKLDKVKLFEVVPSNSIEN